MIFDGLSVEPERSDALRLALPFEDRQKSRLRATLDDGRVIGIKLPRGTLLRHGQCLSASADDALLCIEAAPEPVSTVRSGQPLQLARAAYHLGNRHVWVQLGDSWLRYLTDPVLDQMLAQLGFEVVHDTAPFEPEAGAYAAHGHPHEHHA